MMNSDTSKKRGNGSEVNQVASRIRAKRKSLDLTQSDLAKKIGLSRVAVSKWEDTEAFQEPKASHIYALAKCLRCSIEYLLFGREAPDVKDIGSDVVWLDVNTHPLSNLKSTDLKRIPFSKEQLPDLPVAINLADNSMHPPYKYGTIFIVSMGEEPKAGDLVLATLPDLSTTIRSFKRPTPEGYHLHAFNEDFASYEVKDRNRQFIKGVVLEIREML